jgi:hypothetical protein
MCDTTVANSADIDWELIALVLTYTKVGLYCALYLGFMQLLVVTYSC